MEASEIVRRAHVIMLASSDNPDLRLMEVSQLAGRVPCGKDELMDALHGDKHFNLQPIRNFELLGYGYYTDAELKEVAE